jgi:hypothetical protein
MHAISSICAVTCHPNWGALVRHPNTTTTATVTNTHTCL